MASSASETDTKKAKFSWLGDPASRFRGKARATITRGDMKEMEDYNERLISPLDRPSDRGGGPPLIQRGDQPPPVAMPTRWQQPSTAEGSSIAARYRTPGVATPPNPNLSPSIDTTIGPSPQGAFNPNGNNAATAIPGGGLGTSGMFSETETVADQASRLPGAADALQGAASPAAGGTAVEPANPASIPIPPAPNPSNDPRGSAPTGTQPSGRPDVPQGTVINPATGAPATDFGPSLEEWKANGGSEATFHRMQVVNGLRPRVDARSVASPRNSTAGADIAGKRGWGIDADKDAQGINQQMTNEFDQNNAKSQAEWNSKFTEAHAKLMKSLDNN